MPDAGVVDVQVPPPPPPPPPPETDPEPSTAPVNPESTGNPTRAAAVVVADTVAADTVPYQDLGQGAKKPRVLFDVIQDGTSSPAPRDDTDVFGVGTQFDRVLLDVPMVMRLNTMSDLMITDHV